jgi:ABC-type transporter MlaC component
MIKFITKFALLFALFTTSVFAQQSPEDFTTTTINQSLFELKKFQVSGSTDIHRLISEKFIKNVDVDKSTKYVFNKHWNGFDESQKLSARNYLVKKLIKDYSSLIMSYKQESDVIVNVLPNTRLKNNLAIVSAKIGTHDSDPVKISFKLVNNSSWKLYDVVILGTSLLKTYKYMVNSKIRRKGVEGLFNAL